MWLVRLTALTLVGGALTARNRDPDPLESQVRILFGRSGGQCSYPECGEYLVVPSRARSDMPKNVAKIGHITAASPGGPRFNASLTVEQRRSEPNLMLLCGTHHDAIDSQLEFHTVEWLREAKDQHIKMLVRGNRYAMGHVGFKDLQMVCDALIMGVTVSDDEIDAIEPAIDIDDKIRLNDLEGDTKPLIELGMAQGKEVRTFLASMDQIVAGFSTRLTSRFKALYYRGVSEGLSGDDLFQDLLGAAYENCGPQLSPESEAAALAVLTHLFSICEVFEHEPAATR